MRKRNTATDSTPETNCLNAYGEERRINKFGVPHHRYMLTLENGKTLSMSVGYEEDWGFVQQCGPDDTRYWKTAIGWGNDADGHIKIVAVVDEETGESLNVRQWAKEDVWSYANCYSR